MSKKVKCESPFRDLSISFASKSKLFAICVLSMCNVVQFAVEFLTYGELSKVGIDIDIIIKATEFSIFPLI